MFLIHLVCVCRVWRQFSNAIQRFYFDFYRDNPSSCEITFHVIIPMEAWEWDEHSCMHIRFGKPLGDWKQDFGSFFPRYGGFRIAQISLIKQ